MLLAASYARAWDLRGRIRLPTLRHRMESGGRYSEHVNPELRRFQGLSSSLPPRPRGPGQLPLDRAQGLGFRV